MSLVKEAIAKGYLTPDEAENITHYKVYKDVIERTTKVNGVWQTTREPNPNNTEEKAREQTMKAKLKSAQKAMQRDMNKKNK